MLLELAQLLLMLVIVIALAYLILNKGLAKWLKRSQSSRLIKVKERVALDGRSALYVVQIGQRTVVLGGGDGGISLVADISTDL